MNWVGGWVGVLGGVEIGIQQIDVILCLHLCIVSPQDTTNLWTFGISVRESDKSFQHLHKSR